MSLRAFGGLAAVALAAASCGSDNLYSASGLEATLVDSQRAALEGLTVGEAACPDDVVLTEGVVVPCTMVVEEATAHYEATLTNVAAKEVAVVIQPLDIIIPMAAVVSYVEENSTKAVAGGGIACEPQGARVVIAQPGDTITCTLGIGSQTRDVELEVLDESGTVAFAD